jgi:3-isopropylmalate dehydrogenase
MLETLGLGEEAAAIDAAVLAAINAGQGTPDIGGSLGTRETGEFVAAEIRARSS